MKQEPQNWQDWSRAGLQMLVWKLGERSADAKEEANLWKRAFFILTLSIPAYHLLKWWAA